PNPASPYGHTPGIDVSLQWFEGAPLPQGCAGTLLLRCERGARLGRSTPQVGTAPLLPAWPEYAPGDHGYVGEYHDRSKRSGSAITQLQKPPRSPSESG